jgi:phosphonate transport system substrate-binding protein
MRILRWGFLLLASMLMLFSLQYLVEIYLRMSVRYASSARIDFNDTVDQSELYTVLDQRPILKVAIAPVLSPSRSIAAYRDLALYLGNRLNRKPEIITRKTYLEINDLVQHRQCDLALVCTYPYILGKKTFGMEVLCTPVINNSIHYQSMIIVAAKSPFQSLNDLAGKRFAINDYKSSSGWLFPAQTLLSQNINPDLFFSEVIVTQSHDFSIEAICAGRADGGAVHGAVLDLLLQSDPTIKSKIRIIDESKPWGLPPFVVHPQVSEPLKMELRRLFLDMNNNSEGQLVLKQMGVERFFIPPENFYDSVESDVLTLEPHL